MKLGIILIIFTVFEFNPLLCVVASHHHFNRSHPTDSLHGNHRDLLLFEHGFETHTARIGLRLRKNATTASEIKLLVLRSRSQMTIKYLQQNNELMFHMIGDADSAEKPHSWWLNFPNIHLNDERWHYLVYRFGQKNFKLWIDCELRRNYNDKYKTELNLNPDLMNDFESPTLEYGDSTEVEYNRPVSFVKHPTHHDINMDRKICNKEFNVTETKFILNNNGVEGVFHPLIEFSGNLQRYTSPGAYYQLIESAERDVSEYFENGIDKNHSLEMVYRIKDLHGSNITHYLINLSSNSGAQFSLALNRKRQVIRVYSSIWRNGKNLFYKTEYWAHKIFNDDWHSIKYKFKGGVFTLWIDQHLMEDYLGFKHVDFRFDGYDEQNLWYDTKLMLLEPKSKYNPDVPILHIRTLKYEGYAVTTNNTETWFDAGEAEEETIKPNNDKNSGCMIRSMLKVLLRSVLANDDKDDSNF